MAKSYVEHAWNYLGEENCCPSAGGFVGEGTHINEVLKTALKVVNNHKIKFRDVLGKKGP